jgi:hypothetical protein
VFAIIATENKDVAEMGTKVFMRYKNSLVGLQSSVTAIENPIDAQDELSALKEILEKNYPKIASEVQMAMDQWKIQNKTIQEQLTKTLVYFTPKKEKTGQFLETISGWVNKAWESMKKLTKRLDAILFPQVDKTVAAIEAFEETTGKKKAAACIKRLVNEQYSH